MIKDQTFCFRVLTGERYYDGIIRPPKYYYQSVSHPDADFRRMMAQKCVEYVFPKQANIIRIDHLPMDKLVKLLEYDQKKYKM